MKTLPSIIKVFIIIITISITAFISGFFKPAYAAGQLLGGMNLGGYCQSIGQGGSDLNGSTWICTSTGTAINMTSACQWQYPGQNAVALQDIPGNPYSWNCYAGTTSVTPTPTSSVNPTATPVPTSVVTPTPTSIIAPTVTPTPGSTTIWLGGMNLYGYCQSLGQGGSSLNGSTWVCSTTGNAINMNAACQWQYNPSAFASQDAAGNPYSWSCYSSSSTPTATPTPTVKPTATPTPTPSTKATPTPTPTPTSSTSAFLALGDSFAFGFHLAQYNQEIANNTYNPSSFNDGYDADFYRDLQGILSGITEVNYSCPGETTASFVNGGCAFHSSTSSLHSSYPVSQSQLQAAVSYMQTHPQSVVTIDIGVNDAINLSDICQAQSNPVNCYNQRTAGVLSSVQQNYDTILGALQKAAPQSRIILVKAPDPVYYDGSDALVNGINTIVDNEASSRNLREADTYDIFNASNVCSLTNFCSSLSDFHPNAAGYSAMASVIWNTSGYAN